MEGANRGREASDERGQTERGRRAKTEGGREGVREGGWWRAREGGSVARVALRARVSAMRGTSPRSRSRSGEERELCGAETLPLHRPRGDIYTGGGCAIASLLSGTTTNWTHPRSNPDSNCYWFFLSSSGPDSDHY